MAYKLKKNHNHFLDFRGMADIYKIIIFALPLTLFSSQQFLVSMSVSSCIGIQMCTFEVYQINPAAQRASILENIHSLITAEHNDIQTNKQWQ